MVRNGTHNARSEEEKEAVYRFRYDIYVEEIDENEEFSTKLFSNKTTCETSFERA